MTSTAAAAERDFLGCALVSRGDNVRAQVLSLTQENFGLDANRLIFRRMREMAATGKPFDDLTVVHELTRHREIDAVGGEAYIAELTDGAVERADLSYLLNNVREESTRRQAAKFAEGLQKTADDPTISPARLIEMLTRETARLTDAEHLNGIKPIRAWADIPDVFAADFPPIDYLVPGMISRKSITLWTGVDGTAKTFLVQRMAVEVARGGTFLGRRCQQAQVLYCDYENPAHAVVDRLELITDEPIANLKVWGTWLEQQPPPIGHPCLLRIVKEVQPLLIIDPLRYAHTADENSATEMMAVMQMARAYAVAGAAVVLLHHPARVEGSTGRGSSAIRGAVDVAIMQELDGEGALITLKCGKNRFGDRWVTTVQPDFDEGTFEVTDSPQCVQRDADLDALKRLIAQQPGQSQNQIVFNSGMKYLRATKLLKRARWHPLGHPKGRASTTLFPGSPTDSRWWESVRESVKWYQPIPRFPPLYRGNREAVPGQTDSQLESGEDDESQDEGENL